MTNPWNKHQSNKSRALMMALLILAVYWMCPCVARVYADYGGQSQIQSFFDTTAGFLIKIGTGVFILGLIVAAIKVASTGNENAVRAVVMVLIGGVIIFLARPIVNTLLQFTGSN